MKSSYDFSKAKRAKKTKDVKIIKTFRLDPDVIEWLAAQGEKQGMGYQTFLNWFLRKSIDADNTVEDRLAKLEETVFRKKA